MTKEINKWDAFAQMYNSDLPNESKLVLATLGCIGLLTIGSFILRVVAGIL
jgi:hypothetical protein